MRKLHLVLGSLAARPPVLTVGAVVGSVLASWWAVATGLRTAVVAADLWPRISENLALNFGGLGAALLVLGGIKLIVPERWFFTGSRPLAPILRTETASTWSSGSMSLPPTWRPRRPGGRPGW